MERTRCWRRQKSQTKHLRRIKLNCRRFLWYNFKDANGVRKSSPKWIDMIGIKYTYHLKSQSSLDWTRRHKGKWGKKGKGYYYYWTNYNTRVKDKGRFYKELKEYGY